MAARIVLPRVFAVLALLLGDVAAMRKRFPPRAPPAAVPVPPAPVQAAAVVPDSLAEVEEAHNMSHLHLSSKWSIVYDETEALIYAHFARASYCTACSLATWSCGGACKAASTSSQIVFGPGERHAVQGFVAKLPQPGKHGQECVVSFRGSDNLDNWLANLKLVMSGWNPSGKCPGCKVHTGFREAYEELEPQMFAALDKLGCKSTAVTGHSLGGAVGFLAAFRLRTHKGIKANPVYSYGAPRAGNAAWANTFAATASDGLPAAWRIVQHLDPVPRVPPYYLGFRHFPVEVYYSPDRWLPSLIRNGDNYRVCDGTNGEDSNCARKHCKLFSLCLPYTLHHIRQLGEQMWGPFQGLDCATARRCPAGSLVEEEGAVAALQKDAVALPGSFASIGVKAACSGAADFAESSMCFRGQATLLGLTADLSVNLLGYAGGSGRAEFESHGGWEESCKDIVVSKSGQDVQFDLSRCSNPNGVTMATKYCSDTHTIEVSAKYPPMPFLNLFASLSQVPCGSFLQESAVGALQPHSAQAVSPSLTFPSFGVEAPCEGTADFEGTPMCFKGQETIIGLAADMTVVVHGYAGGSGRADFTSNGDWVEECKELPITKSGQDVGLDLSSCSNPSGVTISTKYCSDTQTLQATAKYPPLPVVRVMVTLHRVPCEAGLLQVASAAAKK